jgi:hypothetical protein
MTIDKGINGLPSPIEFRLDTSSGVPTYLQLVQQVEHALRPGYLPQPIGYCGSPCHGLINAFAGAIIVAT